MLGHLFPSHMSIKLCDHARLLWCAVYTILDPSLAMCSPLSTLNGITPAPISVEM